MRLVGNVGLAATCLGLAPLARKAALSAGAEPLPLSVVTTATAAMIALLYIGAAGLRRLVETLPRRAWVHVLAVGAMGSGAVTLLGILAMTQTTATNRSLFQSMYPVATAIAARFLLGERLRGSAYGIIALMCGGLYMMNASGSGVATGWAFLLLAATLPLIGLADVYAKRTLGDANPHFVVVGRLCFGSLTLLAVLPWTTPAQWQSVVAVWPWIIAAGFAVAGGMLGLYRAMDAVGASLAAAFIALAPVITVMAEWLVLGAYFSGVQLLGLGLVVGGAAALAFRR